MQGKLNLKVMNKHLQTTMKLMMAILLMVIFNSAAVAQVTINMGGNGQPTVTNAPSGTLYDNGGPTGNYSDNANYTLLIQVPGADSIRITFTLFNTEAGWDYLRIYQGTNASGTLLTTMGPTPGSSGYGPGLNGSLTTPFTYTAAGSSMFLWFRSDGSVNYSGWAATWEAVLPRGYNDVGVVAIDSPGVAPCAGSYNVIARVRNFGLNQVTSFNAYWTVNGSIQNPFSFTGVLDTLTETSINLGSFPFTLGVPRTIRVWTSLPNGVVDTLPNNDTSQRTITAALNGTYTIGGLGADFPTFTAAANALSQGGVCGPVTLLVNPGTYTEQVTFGNIPGLSATNTLTINGINKTNRILEFSNTNSNDRHTLKFIDAQFITIKNLTIKGYALSNSGFAYALHFSGAFAQNVLIDSCDVLIDGPNAASFSSSSNFIPIVFSGGIYYYNSLKVDTVTISNTKTRNGYFAVTMYGPTSGPISRNIKFINNDIGNFYYYGLYLYYIENADIIKNEIFSSGLNIYPYNIYWYTFGGLGNVKSNIIGNKIYNFGTYGIYIANVINPTGNKGLFANNIMYGQLLPTGYAVYWSSCSNWMIHHNSINMDAAGSTSQAQSGFYLTGGSANSIINNNFARTKSGLGAPLYVVSASNVDTVNYNNYFKTDTTGLIYLGISYNPSTFKTPTLNANSTNQPPGFLADNDLRVNSGCLTGMPLPSVTTDYLGSPRSATNPTMGAFEYVRKGNDLTVYQAIKPTAPINIGLSDVEFMVRNFGTNTVTSANFGYILNNGLPVTQSWSGTLASCDTLRVTFNLSQQAMLSNVSSFKMYAASPNLGIDSVPENDTLFVNYFTPLAGNYTIGGQGANFSSIMQAANVLRTAGVADSVTFTINPGTYNEIVEISGPIPNHSAATPIKFIGVNRDSVLITGSAGGNAVFKINQVNYITLSDVSVTNTGFGAGIAIIGNNVDNAGTGCVIRNNKVTIPADANASLYCINITGTTTGTGISAQRADSITIENNITNGGYYGIQFRGASLTTANREIKIINNTLNNVYYMGIYAQYIYNGFDLIGNTVNMTNSNTMNINYGVYMLQNQNTVGSRPNRFNNNKVYNWIYMGWYMSTVYGTATAPTQIYNNIISTNRVYSTMYGLYCTGSNVNSRFRVYHNTIINNGAATTSYPVYWLAGTATTPVDFRNNYFAQLSTAPTTAAGAWFTNNSSNTVSFNNYVNRANANVVYRGAFYTAANYQTATTGGVGSRNVDAILDGSTGLLTDGCLRGDTMSFVTTDINNVTRAVNPSMGAIEVSSTANDVSVDALVTPVTPISAGSQNLVVRVKNSGNNTITSFNITYVHNNGTPVTQAWSGTLGICDTVSITFTGTQQINLVTGNNNILVYTSSPNSTADGNPTNDTLRVTYGTPMVGNYVIGTSPSDYPNFTSAINDLVNRGVAGNVNMIVKSGTYNEQITLPVILGASATNRINFTSQTGNKADVTLMFNSTTANTPVLLLQGNWINFRNMTIRQLSTSVSSYTIQLGANASFDTIENCYIAQPSMSVTNYGYIIYASGYSGIGVTFKNNQIRGSYYGTYIFGNSSNRCQYLTFENNVFDSAWYSQFYYLYYTRHTKIHNNHFYHNVNMGAYNYPYMYWYYNDSNFRVTNNRFDMINIVNGYHYNYYGVATVANPAIIANNVYNTHGSGNMTWYFGNSSTQNWLFANNTCQMGSGYVYLANSGLTNFRVRNNIFASTGIYAFYWSAAPNPAISSFDNNLYFASGSSTPIYNGTSALSLPAFKSTYPAFDRYSLSIRPPFTSVSDLTPNPMDTMIWAINGRGVQLAEITADINGVARPTTRNNGAPDIGAFEATPGLNVLPPLATAVPAAPVQGGTQVFLFGLDTVAKITYDAFSNAPSSVALRYYTGVTPNIQGVNGKYLYEYFDFATTGFGNYLYQFNHYYKPALLGTVSNETSLRSAYRTGSNWVGNLLTASTPDSVAKQLITPNMSVAAAQYTGTDNNDPLISFLTITQQPANASKCAGQVAQFVTAATGTNITYQWQVDTGSGFTNISGATNDTLEFTVTANMNGYVYRCQITSTNGTANTNNAVLTVLAPVTITSQPQPAAGCAGSNVQFSVAATGAGLTYQWLLNNVPIPGATNATLNLNSITVSMNGNSYRCLVSGTCTSDTSNAAILTITPALSINTQPAASVFSCAGTSASFSVSAVGVTSYQWQLNDGSGWFNINGATAASYNIASTTKSMNGNQYRVVLTGGCGFLISNASLLTVEQTGDWKGTTSSAWATASNWGCGVLPTSTTNVLIPATAPNMPVLSANATIGSLTIENNATITLSGAAVTLNVTGNLNNSGTITNSGGTIALSGTTPQTLNAGTYGNKLTINNAAGVNLAGNLQLNDTLTLANGKLTIGSNNITLGTGGFISGANASRYIVAEGSGSVVITNIGTGGRTGAVLFPVGTATQYNPATINNLGTADNYSVRLIGAAYGNFTGNNPVITSVLSANAVNATWIIEEAVQGGSNATVTLQWNGSQELSGFARANCYVARHNGTTWLASSAGAAAGTNPYTRSLSQITAFSPFGVGSGGTLPVEMVSFTATPRGKAAELNWVTASEVNNNHFIVERSSDNENFIVVGTVKGAGNSSMVNAYNLVDNDAKAYAVNNLVYYRLTQVDRDGSKTYAGTAVADFGDVSDEVVVMPNPFTNTITVKLPGIGNHQVVVRDVTGKVLLTKMVDDASSVVINELSSLSAGVYFVVVNNDQVVKVIKQ